MKTIKLKNVIVKEVILIPEGVNPLAVLYEIKDDTDKVIMTKRVQVKEEDMPPAAKNAIDSLVSKITSRITQLEEI